MKNITLSDRIREYIKTNFKEPFTVDSACSEFHISRSTLSHAVKDEQNSTFVDILNSYRIKHVQNCLENGESIADAAYMSGFNSENYMARIFKRSIGVSPSEYRQSVDKKQAVVR
jgi:two-component system response regulator YesN